MTWTWQRIKTVSAALVLLWFVGMLVAGPGDLQGILWNLGLLIIIFACLGFLQLFSWLMESNMAIWPTGRTTLKAQSWTKEVELPHFEGNSRSTRYYMFEGGLHRYSLLHTKPREVLFVNHDCLRIDKGDLVHNYIRGQPVWHRDIPNPKAGEVSKISLALEFKEALVERGIPANVPVGVVYEPVTLELDAAKFKEAVAYREMMQQANKAYTDLVKVSESALDATTKIASTHAKVTGQMSRDSNPKKPGLLERITRDEGDGQ